jgi:hypothetical protein
LLRPRRHGAALRKIEARISSADRFGARSADPHAPERGIHSMIYDLRFRILMVAAGYEDPRGTLETVIRWRGECAGKSRWRRAHKRR